MIWYTYTIWRKAHQKNLIKKYPPPPTPPKNVPFPEHIKTKSTFLYQVLCEEVLGTASGLSFPDFERKKKNYAGIKSSISNPKQ